MLSFFGASFILWDILSSRKARAMVYHQLLIGMAIFDITTAVSWSFASAPINPNDPDDPDAFFIQGAMGNDATCKAQAFFIQLGFTSIFYNVSLAICSTRITEQQGGRLWASQQEEHNAYLSQVSQTLERARANSRC